MDDAAAGIVYDCLLKSGTCVTGEYPPPPWHYPEGMKLPEKLSNLTAGLLCRGFSEGEVKSILGGNYFTIIDAVALGFSVSGP